MRKLLSNIKILNVVRQIISRYPSLSALSNHIFLKYLSSTAWLLFEKIFRTIIGLIVTVWVVRYLGPEKFGLFSYTQSFAGMFTVIASLGLDGIVVRELVRDGSKRDALLGTAFGLKVVGAFISIAIIATAVNFTSNDTYTNTLIFIIACATIFQSFNVIDYFFIAEVRSRYVVFSSIISLFISSLAKITLILCEAHLVFFVLVLLLDSLVLAIGLLIFYTKAEPIGSNRKLRVSDWIFDKKLAISMLKDSYPLILSSVAIVVYMRIDQVMIKEMLGDKDVGLFSAGIKIVEAMYFIPVIITASLFPAIVNLKNASQKDYEIKFQYLMSFMFWGSVFLILPINLFAENFMPLLFGEKYYASYKVTEIYCWVFIFTSLGVTSSKWLLAENLQIFSMYRTYLGMAINILLNYLWIPKYGIVGAAYASLISQIFSSYLGYILNNKTWKIFKIQTNGILPFYLLKHRGNR